MMNAKIKVESQLGKGTHFIITLPLTVSDHSDREKTPYRMPKANKHSLSQSNPVKKDKIDPVTKTDATATILIVEDNLLAAKAVQSNLNRLYPRCMTSDIAATGMDAIKMVQLQTYDLIIMDIGLPDIEGIEVTRQIRAFNIPKIAQIPIVALTGHANNPEKRQEALTAGMQEVLAKPLAPSQLELLLQRYVFNSKQAIPLVETKKATLIEALPPHILDWHKSLEQLGGDENCLRELLSVLAIDLRSAQEKIARGYAAHDEEALRNELHRVRGGVAYLTLPQLDKALAEFHDAVKAKPQDSEVLMSTYRQLEKAMNMFWELLEQNNLN